jgi:hypothetical protein
VPSEVFRSEESKSKTKVMRITCSREQDQNEGDRELGSKVDVRKREGCST